jgi:hypothetical protein
VFINALKVLYSHFLACSESALTVQIIFVIFMGGDVFITEACHNPDHQESLPSLLWMPDWGTGQELGPAHMLQTFESG